MIQSSQMSALAYAHPRCESLPKTNRTPMPVLGGKKTAVKKDM